MATEVYYLKYFRSNSVIHITNAIVQSTVKSWSACTCIFSEERHSNSSWTQRRKRLFLYFSKLAQRGFRQRNRFSRALDNQKHAFSYDYSNVQESRDRGGRPALPPSPHQTFLFPEVTARDPVSPASVWSATSAPAVDINVDQLLKSSWCDSNVQQSCLGVKKLSG